LAEKLRLRNLAHALPRSALTAGSMPAVTERGNVTLAAYVEALAHKKA
jgi:hypothetical protein